MYQQGNWTPTPPSPPVPPRRTSRNGVLAAAVGSTALVATIVTVLVTGAFDPLTTSRAQPSHSASEDRRNEAAYRFDKTLCGAMDWSVIDAVAKIKDDVDAANKESEADRTVTVECSVLLEGHPESQIYVNVTTFASAADAQDAHDMVSDQQSERVDEVTGLDGDWEQGQLGIGQDGVDVYVDALVQDSNAAGSVVVALSGDTVTDRTGQEEQAREAVAKIAASMFDVLRR